VTETCIAADADATRAWGARLANALLRPEVVPVSLVITLEGDLGAGKTTFVSGLLAALGHDGPVRSPTYTLIEPYRLAGRDIQHCDLYRLRTADELDDLGWRDLPAPGAILLIEWPDKAGDRLGPVDLAVMFAYEGTDARRISFGARSKVGQVLVDAL
jgi:tRNA threonylcarbamoyladenosine biosynthesis protein TsaE